LANEFDQWWKGLGKGLGKVLEKALKKTLKQIPECMDISTT